MERFPDILPTETEAGRKQEKIKKLFGHCFEISRIENNDKLPVGGRSVFLQNADVSIQCDFDSVEKFFRGVHTFTAAADRKAIEEYLLKNKIDIESGLFVPLLAVTKGLEKKLPPPGSSEEKARRHQRREELVEGPNARISEVIGEGVAECAEIAAVAQRFLQDENISSSYFSGDILRSKDEEYSEEHSFVVVPRGGKTYIFDPANPLDTTGGLFPNISVADGNFDEEMQKGRKKFVTCRNIVTGKETYYGVNDGTDVIPGKDIA